MKSLIKTTQNRMFKGSLKQTLRFGLCLLLQLAMLPAFAGEEKVTSVAKVRSLNSSSTMSVENRYYGSINSPFVHPGEGQLKVKLYFDRDYEASASLYTDNTTFQVRVNYNITYQYFNGFGSVNTTTSSNQSLTIQYDALEGGEIIDRIEKDYSNPSGAVRNVIKGDISINSIQVLNGSGSVISRPVPHNTILEMELNSRKYIGVTGNTTVSNAETLDLTNRYLHLSYPFVPGYDFYEIEWLFISDGSTPPADHQSSSIPVDFNRANRIRIRENYYALPLEFSRGSLIHRYRGVSNTSNGGFQYTAWNYTPTTSTISGIQSDQASAGNTNNFYFYIDTPEALNPGLNWEYSSTFAENGLRKDQLRFFDGLGRDKQTVTLLSSDGNAVVLESEYDYAGRPALNLMPAPVTSQGLQYYAANSAFQYDDHFSDTRLDNVVTGANETPAPLASSAFAEQYYSSANSIVSDFKNYIPDAGGYAYSQSQFDNNGTGRVVQQGGAGSDFTLKSGKNKRFIYGRPTQEELDRLFGNEAGLSINYSKDFVIDENGQISITYKDGSNRVIATCLSGDVPSGMFGLATDSETITSNLFGNKTEVSQGEFEDFTVVTVPIVGNYTFNYNLDTLDRDPTCTTNNGIDMMFGATNSGIFDIEISLVNVRTGDVEMSYTGSFNQMDTTITLQPGSYMLRRSIKPDENDLELTTTLVWEYLIDLFYNIDKTYFEPCLVYNLPDITADCATPGCSTSCKDAYTIEVGGVTQYLDEDGNIYSSYDSTVTSDPVTMAIDKCRQNCITAEEKSNDVDYCAIKYGQMRNDMSLGGQYFENIPPRLQYDELTDTILLAANGLPLYNSSVNWYDWLEGEYGSLMGLANALNLTPAESYFDSWEDVKTKWDDSWADLLVVDHPEYCIYEIYCECINNNSLGVEVWGYVNRMNRDNTDAYATSDPTFLLFNPLAQPYDDNTTSPDRDHSEYINYTAGQYDTVIVDGSSMLNTGDGPCEILFQTDNDAPHGWNLIRGNIMERLRNFITFTPLNSSKAISHSIWFVMEDPLGIAEANGGNNRDIPDYVIDFYNQLHGAPGVDNALFDISDRYMFFRGVYLFYREMALYDMIKSNEACSLLNQDKDRDDYDGLTAAKNGWRLVYPPNQLFDNFTNFLELGTLQEFAAENLPESVEDPDIRNCICERLNTLYEDLDQDWASVEAYLLGEHGSSPSIAELQLIYNNCQNEEYANLNLIQGNPEFTNCFYGEGFDGTASMLPEYDSLACINAALRVAERLAYEQYQQDKEALIAQMKTDYLADCREQVLNYETFSMSYVLDEYHYTLYYYDQAGNLVRTIPPEGVNIIKVTPDPITDPSLSEVQDHRDDPVANAFIRPNHDYQTHYRYNTLNQLIWQFTPDGGSTKFWYDRLGRVVLSQNAKQAANTKHSYTLYDRLGRVMESGQCALSAVPTYGEPVGSSELNGSISNREEVIYSLYDKAYTGISSNINQQYLQNRVSASFYFSTLSGTVSDINRSGIDASGNLTHPFASIEHAYVYDYDVLGNVKTLYAYDRLLNIAGQSYITMEYEYDILSGSVKKVAYEPGTTNSFYHRYTYDADNRIKYAETSPNNEIWDREASYYYYPHGPLARVEMGEQLVQGQDYMYTIQGWLKAVNSSTLGENNLFQPFDIGEDGNTQSSTNPHVARDAFAYSLSYFGGDYSAINSLSTSPIVSNIPTAITANDLFNGNISAMSNQMKDNTQTPVQAHLNGYKYDQLNRLKRFDTYADDLLSSSNTAENANTTAGNFGARYAYDANGNLTGLRRKNDQAQWMDRFAYTYEDASVGYKRNRLLSLNDTSTINSGIDIQIGLGSYTYDAVGNLTSDSKEGINTINWTMSNKVKGISKSNGDQFGFTYDALGNRATKTAPSSGSGSDRTFYVRDLQGNIMATYLREAGQTNAAVKEFNLYGSDRAGVWSYQSNATSGSTASTYTRKLSHKSYELKNHLGNVLSVVSDAPLYESDAFAVNDDFNDGTIMGWIGAGQNNTSGLDPTLLSNYSEQLLVETTRDFGNALVTRHLAAGAVYDFTVDLEVYKGPNALSYPPQIRLIVQDRTTGVSTVISQITTGTGTQSVTFTVPGTTGSRDMWMMVVVPGAYRTQPYHYLIDNATVIRRDPMMYKEADVISYQDYYPFGMQMPGRFAQGKDHRYGFNGMEKDDEIKGNGNSYDFGLRLYDPRNGRWFSPDPEAQFIASQYLSFANNPILLVDPDGGWVPGVDAGGRIIITAEEGDNLESLYAFFGGKENAQDYLPNFWTNDKVASKITIQTGSKVRFNTENIFSEAMAHKKQSPEAYYDTHSDPNVDGDDIPDTYNCHQAACSASQGESFVNSGNLDVEDRNNALGKQTTAENAVFGQTIITFGNDHSSVFFGKSKDGTVYTFSKHGDKWSPDIVPVNYVVNGGPDSQVPGNGYGPVREPGEASQYLKDEDLNKDGTVKDENSQGGYYEPKEN